MIETRCDRGARVVAMLGTAAAAAAVRSLDEHWDGNGRPEGLGGEEIPLFARIASLAQTAEIFYLTDGWEAAADVVRKRRGRWFDPRVADAYLSIAADDPLWPRMRDGAVIEALLADDPDGTPAMADGDRLDRIAEAFGDVIDAKSPYTARHSARVARFAVAIGAHLGLEPEALRTLRRAALLHDVGKLGLSNSILDKPGRLHRRRVRPGQDAPPLQRADPARGRRPSPTSSSRLRRITSVWTAGATAASAVAVSPPSPAASRWRTSSRR